MARQGGSFVAMKSSANSKSISQQMKTVKADQLEVLNWKNEAFAEVLEEFEKGNDIEARKFIDFVVRYETRDLKEMKDKKDNNIEEIEIEKKEQIKERFNLNDYERMTMRQCMDLILYEIEDDTEDGLLEAFKVFDEEDTGMVKLSTLKMIMEDYGPLGYTLTEEQVIRMLEMFDIDYEPVDLEKQKEEKEELKKSRREKEKKEAKKRKEREKAALTDNPEDRAAVEVLKKEKKKEPEEVKEEKLYVEIPEYVKGGQRHIRYVKDVNVDYRMFSKKIMEMITQQESTLWGGKE